MTRTACMVATFLGALLYASCADAQSKLAVPLYKQCDPQWANDTMGKDATICQQGCAMSCVAMSLAARGFRVGDHIITPKTLNAWLRTHNGYTCIDGDCNNLVLPVIDNLTSYEVDYMSEKMKPGFAELCHLVEDEARIVILHVRNRTHFVLAVACDRSATGFHVHDPFFNADEYPYQSVADVILYRSLVQ